MLAQDVIESPWDEDGDIKIIGEIEWSKVSSDFTNVSLLNTSECGDLCQF